MPPDDEPIAKDAYDELADEYAAQIDTNPYNVELEFPGTTGLVPDVDGERVLDAGCGTGLYTEWLLDRGADVVGVDASEEMLDHAADRVGDRAELHRGDLARPLDFAAENEFDGVVSALVLGYLEDWREPFAEFARVLKPGGFLVLSDTHPIEDFCDDEGAGNYFETERLSKEWWSVEVPHYRRPLSEILNPLVDAGFRLDGIAEPQPTEAFREQRPEVYEKESRQPVFLCLRAVKR